MNSRVGLSICSGGELAALPERLPPFLTLLEFPGELLEVTGERKRLARFRSPRTTGLARDMVDAGVARLIAGESLPVRLEFLKLLRARCRYAAELRVRELSLDFDLERAAAEPAWFRQVLMLLRGCFGILDEFGLTLRLPLRLSPESGGVSPSRFVELRRAMLYPAIGPLLECRCEEFAAAGVGTGALIGPVAFYAECWRIGLTGASCPASAGAALKRLIMSAPVPARIHLAPESGFFEDFLAEPEVAAKPFLWESKPE